MRNDDLSALSTLPGAPAWPPQGLTTGGPGSSARGRAILYWLAVGLGAVSVSTGLLYHFHYTRVGNQVTSLLPRDTSLYVRFGGPEELLGRIADLTLWDSSRPIRRLVSDEEDAFLRSTLYDLGINRHYLSALESGVTAIHVALVPAAPKPEVLVFLELTDKTAELEIRARVLDNFDPGDEVEGVQLLRHRSPGRDLHAAGLERLIIFAQGGDTALRALLENREHSQSRSLNDSESFRHAWLAQAGPSHLFAYASPETVASVHQILPSLGLDGGVGLTLRLEGGLDNATLSAWASDSAHALSGALGVDTKRTLSSVPSTAMAAVAVSVGDPHAFGRLVQGVLPSPDLKELQARSDRSLVRDVYPLLAGEAALAVIPERHGNAWLAVLRSHDPEQLADVLEDLTRTWVHTQPLTRGARVGSTASGVRVLLAYPLEDPSAPVQGVEGPELLAWRVSGANLLVGSSASAVDAAHGASQSGDGLAQLPSVVSALAGLPVRNSAVAVGRLSELLAVMEVPKRLLRLVDERFLGALAVTARGDELQVSANVSPLSLGLLSMAARRAADRPELCRALIRQVCANNSDCADFRAKVRGASAETCASALETLARLESGTRG